MFGSALTIITDAAENFLPVEAPIPPSHDSCGKPGEVAETVGPAKDGAGARSDMESPQMPPGFGRVVF